MKAKRWRGLARLLSCARRIGVIAPCALGQLKAGAKSVVFQHKMALSVFGRNTHTSSQSQNTLIFVHSFPHMRVWISKVSSEHIFYQK